MALEATARRLRRNRAKVDFYLCCRGPSNDESFHFSALWKGTEMLAGGPDEGRLFDSMILGFPNVSNNEARMCYFRSVQQGILFESESQLQLSDLG